MCGNTTDFPPDSKPGDMLWLTGRAIQPNRLLMKITEVDLPRKRVYGRNLRTDESVILRLYEGRIPELDWWVFGNVQRVSEDDIVMLPP